MARLPEPLFILTCMRSYSSLACAMLGQHPDLYGLPEVNLFAADRVGGWLRTFRLIRPASMHGLLRSLAQLHDGEQTPATIQRAQHWLEARQDWSTVQVFQHLQACVAPRRLVEKSPLNVLAERCLQRLYAAYPQASLLHLTRHPASTCASIHRLMQETAQRTGGRQAAQADPERLWQQTHRNILSLSKRTPPGQLMRLHGECWVGDNATYLPQVLEWLDLPAGPAEQDAVRHPERSPFACPGPDNARFGNDPGFLGDPRFRPAPARPVNLAQGWQADGQSHAFSTDTLVLARRLGYS